MEWLPRRRFPLCRLATGLCGCRPPAAHASPARAPQEGATRRRSRWCAMSSQRALHRCAAPGLRRSVARRVMLRARTSVAFVRRARTAAATGRGVSAPRGRWPTFARACSGALADSKWVGPRAAGDRGRATRPFRGDGSNSERGALPFRALRTGAPWRAAAGGRSGARRRRGGRSRAKQPVGGQSLSLEERADEQIPRWDGRERKSRSSRASAVVAMRASSWRASRKV